MQSRVSQVLRFHFSNFGKNTMSESWKWIIRRQKSVLIFFETKLQFLTSFKQIGIPNFRIKMFYQVPVEIRQIYLKPDRNRNRILKPEIRPEPDSAGFPVGSYTVL